MPRLLSYLMVSLSLVNVDLHLFDHYRQALQESHSVALGTGVSMCVELMLALENLSSKDYCTFGTRTADRAGRKLKARY